MAPKPVGEVPGEKLKLLSVEVLEPAKVEAAPQDEPARDCTSKKESSKSGRSFELLRLLPAGWWPRLCCRLNSSSLLLSLRAGVELAPLRSGVPSPMQSQKPREANPLIGVLVFDSDRERLRLAVKFVNALSWDISVHGVPCEGGR